MDIIGNENPTIVCVEDDPDALEFIRLALRNSGYTFIGVTDPREALDVLKRYTPDVVNQAERKWIHDGDFEGCFRLQLRKDIGARTTPGHLLLKET